MLNRPAPWRSLVWPKTGSTVRPRWRYRPLPRSVRSLGGRAGWGWPRGYRPMNDRFLSVRASLLLARRALERQLALIEARERPDTDAFAEVAAHLDGALRELEALEKGGPLRVWPGGGGGDGRGGRGAHRRPRVPARHGLRPRDPAGEGGRRSP